jgi:aspartate carbamoyltransferase catalytic subunit
MVDLAGHSILECFFNNSRRRQRSFAIVKLGVKRRELAEKGIYRFS